MLGRLPATVSETLLGRFLMPQLQKKKEAGKVYLAGFFSVLML